MDADCLASPAKSSGLSLYQHLCDTMEISDYLYDSWLADHLKKRFSKKELRLCCALHDIGKASRAFQKQSERFKHTQIGAAMILKAWNRHDLAKITALHHGIQDDIRRFKSLKKLPMIHPELFDPMPDMDFILSMAGCKDIQHLRLIPDEQIGLAAGWVMLCDHLASMENFYPPETMRQTPIDPRKVTAMPADHPKRFDVFYVLHKKGPASIDHLYQYGDMQNRMRFLMELWIAQNGAEISAFSLTDKHMQEIVDELEKAGIATEVIHV